MNEYHQNLITTYAQNLNWCMSHAGCVYIHMHAACTFHAMHGTDHELAHAGMHVLHALIKT